MKIKFVGAVGKVTGSCTWCIHPRTGTQFLVDCGLVQGGMHQEAENNMPFPFDSRQLKFVLLTHAHMDHCGRIPQLYAQGFRGKVICTTATAELAMLQLHDAYNNQSQKRGPKSVVPRRPHPRWFRRIDERCDFKFRKALQIDDGLFVAFRRSSHMLGCCSITVFWTEPWDHRKSVCFSGDIGPAGAHDIQAPMMESNQLPHPQCPYLVVESTKGGDEAKKGEHKHFVSRLYELERIVSDHRTIVIPCFSMQRTQEVLFDLWSMLHDDPDDDKFSGLEVVLDSPLAKDACKVYRKELTLQKPGRGEMYLNKLRRFQLRAMREDVAKALGGSGWISRAKILDEQGGPNASGFDPADGEHRVVVTSSGMCHTGRVLSYLPLLEEPDAAFVITGYQSTFNGRQLRGAAAKQAKGKWHGKISLRMKGPENGPEKIRVRASVFDLGPYYSGHADIDGLMEYVLGFDEMDPDFWKPLGPRIPSSATVFLNHGDDAAREKMREKILADHPGNRWDQREIYRREISKVEIPHADGPFFDLERGEWEERPAELVRRLIKTLARRGDGARPPPRRRDAAKKSGNGV